MNMDSRRRLHCITDFVKDTSETYMCTLNKSSTNSCNDPKANKMCIMIIVAKWSKMYGVESSPDALAKCLQKEVQIFFLNLQDVGIE